MSTDDPDDKWPKLTNVKLCEEDVAAIGLIRDWLNETQPHAIFIGTATAIRFALRFTVGTLSGMQKKERARRRRSRERRKMSLKKRG